MVHEQHRVFVGFDFYLALVLHFARGIEDFCHANDFFYRSKQAGERRYVIDTQIIKAAAALLVEPPRPAWSAVAIRAVAGSDASDPAAGDSVDHELELRTRHAGRRAPEMHPVFSRQIQELLAILDRERDRLFGPNMAFGL